MKNLGAACRSWQSVLLKSSTELTPIPQGDCPLRSQVLQTTWMSFNWMLHHTIQSVSCFETYKTLSKEAKRLTPISDPHNCEVSSHCTDGNLLYTSRKLRQTFYDICGYCFTSSFPTINHKPMSEAQTTTQLSSFLCPHTLAQSQSVAWSPEDPPATGKDLLVKSLRGSRAPLEIDLLFRPQHQCTEEIRLFLKLRKVGESIWTFLLTFLTLLEKCYALL